MHELSKKIIETAHPWGDFKKMDLIITDWLREKANTLSHFLELEQEGAKHSLNIILGLTEDSKMKEGPVQTMVEVTEKFMGMKKDYVAGNNLDKGDLVFKKDYDLDEHKNTTSSNINPDTRKWTPAKESPVSGGCQNCENKKPGEYMSVVFEPDNYSDSKHSIIAKCAICFQRVPRPSKPSLRDELAEKIQEYCNQRFSSELTGKLLYHGAYEGLSEICLDFLKSRKGEL